MLQSKSGTKPRNSKTESKFIQVINRGLFRVSYIFNPHGRGLTARSKHKVWMLSLSVETHAADKGVLMISSFSFFFGLFCFRKSLQCETLTVRVVFTSRARCERTNSRERAGLTKWPVRNFINTLILNFVNFWNSSRSRTTPITFRQHLCTYVIVVRRVRN